LGAFDSDVFRDLAVHVTGHPLLTLKPASPVITADYAVLV
jgi:hypothetical protein